MNADEKATKKPAEPSPDGVPEDTSSSNRELSGFGIKSSTLAEVIGVGLATVGLAKSAGAQSASGSITTSQVYVDVDQLDFGVVRVGHTESYVAKITNITNPPVNVTITSVDFTYSYFLCPTPIPILITPGETVPFVLEFAPVTVYADLSVDGIAYIYLDNSPTTDISIDLSAVITGVVLPTDSPAALDPGTWYTSYDAGPPPADPGTTSVGVTNSVPPPPGDTPPPTYFGE